MIIDFLFKKLKTEQTAIKNTFWLALSEVVSGFLKLVLIINVARILGATEYGKFTFALSFVSIFVIFSDFGLSAIATREMVKNKKEEDNYPAVFSLKIILSLIVLFLMILFSIFITADPSIKRIIWILSIYAIVTSFNEIIYAFFRARQKMEYESLTKIIQAILITLVGFFIIFKIPSIYNLSFAYLFVGAIILILLLFFFHFKISPIKISLKKSVWQKLLSSSWPLGLTTIFITNSIYVGSVVMGYFHLFTEVGWYNAAFKIIMVLIIPSELISQGFYPIMCKAFVESKEALQKAWNYQALFKIIILIPIVIGGIFLAPEIINLIYGPNFVPSILVFRILMIVCILCYINDTFYQALLVANMQKKIIFFSFCIMMFGILANFILIPIFSLYGAAIVLSATCFLDFLLGLTLVLKLTSVKPFNFKGIFL